MAIIVPAQQTAIANLYTALFNRAPDAAGFGFWVQSLSNGASLASITQGFLSSLESKAIYPSSQTSEQFITTFYTTVFGRAPDVAGLAFWAGVVNANGGSSSDVAKAAAVAQIIAIVSTPLTAKPDGITDAQYAETVKDRAIFANKVAVGVYYALEAKGTSTDTAKQVLAGVDATAASVTAAKQTADGAAGGGTTFVLTSSVDFLNGTSGNDTFIADNTGAAATLGLADSVNGGAGTDTLKVYVKATDSVSALVLPTLNSIEKLYINNGVLTSGTTFNASTITGVTSIELDSPAAAASNDNFTIKTLATQNVALSNVTGANNASFRISLDGAMAATLNNVRGTGTGVATINVLTAATTALTLTATGTASTVTLTNTGATLASLTIAGDKALTVSEGLTALKTIDASAATGVITVKNTTTAANLDAGFTFKGGAGGSVLSLTAGSLSKLASGAQLSAGAALTDKISIADATLTGKDYVALNAATGFEVLGLNANNSVIDAGQLNTIKSFAIDADIDASVSNLSTGSSAFVAMNSGTLTFGGKLGVSDLSITFNGTASVNDLAVTGLTNIALVSGGTGAHFVGTLTNSDNSLITITGAQNLTINSALAATTTGSKVDASALTGTLTVTGSTKADILIGGTNDDTLIAGGGNDTLTGGAGKDTFNLKFSAGATVTITDFVLKTDNIVLLDKGTEVFTSAKLDVSSAGSLGAALNLAAAGDGSTNAQLKWFQFGGDTYLVEDVSAATTVAAGDIVVKLAGIVDLSTAVLGTDYSFAAAPG